ncbi:MAG: IS110 family transposase [Candidatus Cybelea sp.]
MNKNSASSRPSEPQTFVGLDVHKETIAIAVADRGSAGPRSLGIIHNDLDELRKALRRLGSPTQLQVCYEAGACGYAIYRFLTRLKIECLIVAPSLIPRKPGDRVKTDRRDALALARLLRSGDLTATWVPDPQHEALRDVVRAREDAVEDRLRAWHRLTKFLLRLAINPPPGIRARSVRYRRWLDGLRFDDVAQGLVFVEYRHCIEEIDQRITRFERQLEDLVQCSPHAPTIAALQAIRGIKLLTATTIVTEVGDLGRFASARQLMAYAGLVPSEHSSGNRLRRGCITKSGNAHLRRVLVETAWHARLAPRMSDALRRRQESVHRQVATIAWNAQHRLYRRYRHLCARGKRPQQAAVAVARELLGFIWAIGQVVRSSNISQKVAA